MIIFFDKNSDELAGQSKVSLEALFTELCRAYLSGTHYIVISRDSCKWAMENLPLSEMHIGALKSLHAKYSERGGIISHALWYLRIDFGSHCAEIADGHSKIGHIDFIKGRTKDLPRFIVEDRQSDGELFSIILNHQCKSHITPAWKADIINGGGSSIVKNFDDNLKAGHVSVAVLDGDRFCPASGSSSAKKSIDKIIAQDGSRAFCFSLPCRDVENLIPARVFIDNSLPHSINGGCANIISAIDYGSHPDGEDCPWMYFDAKDGITQDFIDKHLSTGAINDYYKSMVYKGGAPHPVSGFSSGALGAFLNSGPANRQFIDFLKSGHWRSKYKDIFDYILWVFCADKTLYAF